MGREFNDLFEMWADSYDLTVTGHDEEYKDVFKNYDDILKLVADKSVGTVLEFGVGTGNLTRTLIQKGHIVFGIEPSQSMREIAISKLGSKVAISDGDFIQFKLPDVKIDTIVSSYAFHHLTDDEKANAFAIYSKFLQKGGKIVFADTIFENELEYKKMINNAKAKGYSNLANDLQSEYYTTKAVLTKSLVENGFDVNYSRCNDFVLVMEATKIIE
jgi:putative AdoMet-dependent methyltransferase